MTVNKRKSPAPSPGLNGTVRVGRLDNLSGVLREMGKVYRATRRGEISSSDASKFIYILNNIRIVIECADKNNATRKENEYQNGHVSTYTWDDLIK